MASDGQTLASQPASVQSAFNTAFGGNAASQWDSQHNAAIGGGSTQPPNPLGGIDPAQVQLMQQQNASANWMTLLGFYDPSAPQNLAPNTLSLQAMNDLGFLSLPGQQANMPTISEQQQTGTYFDPVSNTWKPTLTGIAQDAALTGLYKGAPTASQLNTAGYVMGPNGALMPTEQSQNTFMTAIQNLLSNNNSLTPFTYLSQQRGIGNALNPLASFLKGGIFGATGQTQQQLANQQNMTVSNSASNILANGGNTAQSFIPQMMNLLYNSVPASVHSQALQGGNGAPIQDGSNNTAFKLPTGFTTGVQGFNQLSPTAQSAAENLIQTAGGENPTDFVAGMKAAMPEFQKSASSQVANFGQL